MRPPVPSLGGRRCFITGAASGIGRATAGSVAFAAPADVSDHAAVAALAEEIEIVGADDEDSEIQKLKRRFERHAVSPEHVAEKILEGIEKNRYLVFTSNDIRVAFWLQRWFPPAYKLAMRTLNRRFVAVAGGR